MIIAETAYVKAFLRSARYLPAVACPPPSPPRPFKRSLPQPRPSKNPPEKPAPGTLKNTIGHQRRQTCTITLCRTLCRGHIRGPDHFEKRWSPIRPTCLACLDRFGSPGQGPARAQASQTHHFPIRSLLKRGRGEARIQLIPPGVRLNVIQLPLQILWVGAVLWLVCRRHPSNVEICPTPRHNS